MIYQKKSGSAHYFPEEEEKGKKKGRKVVKTSVLP
jgi:hypothetical protein